jgi:hypothetical protein
MQEAFATAVRNITAELREEIARKDWKERRHTLPFWRAPGAGPASG